MSYLPSSLRTEGTLQGPVEDYLAFVGRLAAQWPAGTRNTTLLVGTEFGYAPNTPRQAAVGTGTSGTTGGFAWQLQLSVVDVRPGHSFALQHGRVQAGWLISPDFRNNEVLSEVRYEWKIDQRHVFTARFRRRDEIDIAVGATRKRQDDDFF